MKKIILSGLFAAMLGTGAYFASQYHQRADLSEIQLANIEALGNCEVKDAKGKVVVSCEGNEGVCWEKGNLYCSGKRVI